MRVFFHPFCIQYVYQSSWDGGLAFSRDFSIFLWYSKLSTIDRYWELSHSANMGEYTKFFHHWVEIVSTSWLSMQSPYHWHCNPYTFTHLRHLFNRIQCQTPHSLRVRRGLHKCCIIRNSSFVLRKRNAAILERLKLCALGETLTTFWACAKKLCVIYPRGIKKR